MTLMARSGRCRIVALRDRDMMLDNIDRTMRHTHIPYIAIDFDGQAPT
jgi:hypothetical protein